MRLIFRNLHLIIILILCQEKLYSQEINDYVSQKIDSMRKVYNFPSVAYGVIRNDSIIVINTVGYRDIENKDKAQPEIIII